MKKRVFFTTMNTRTRFYILSAVLILGVASCSTGKKYDNWFSGKVFNGSLFKGDSPLFEKPPEKILFTDQEVFRQALELHQKGQVQPAIQLWKQFIAQHPKSFEAFNNLGMSYYANDDLDNAVKSFESAMQLEPANKKVQDNMIRTLRFRSTLAKENNEHPKAVADLQKIAFLAAPGGKEKILKEIEQEQDIIYKQVERTNSIAAYEDFANQYPNSIFAEKAKMEIARLTPPPVKRKQFESRPGPWPPQAEQPIKPEPPVKSELNQGTIPQPMVRGNLNQGKMAGEPVSQVMPEPTLKMPAGKMQEMAASPPASPMAPMSPKMQKPAPATQKMAAVPPKTASVSQSRKVKIITKNTALNVRKAPSAKSPIIGKVKKGTTHSVLEEKSGWFHIVYSKGKTTGWISKKFSRIIK